MKEGKNPKMESKMKWMDPIAFHRIHDEEGKKERIQGTMNTVFCYKYSVLDNVWEKD